MEPQKSEISIQEELTLRMQEYTVVSETLNRISNQRQNVDAFYGAINTVLLTGIGYLFTVIKLVPWWPVVFFPLFAFAGVIINTQGWLAMKLRLRNLEAVYSEYLSGLEQHFEAKGLAPVKLGLEAANSEMQVYSVLGINRLRKMSNQFRNRLGYGLIERQIVLFFDSLYVVLAALAVIITILNAFGYPVPPLVTH